MSETADLTQTGRSVGLRVPFGRLDLLISALAVIAVGLALN